MNSRNKKLIKGSGVLVVIFSALATSVYMISTFADYEHFNTQVDKYKKNLSSIYQKKVDNVDNVYNILQRKIESKNDYNVW